MKVDIHTLPSIVQLPCFQHAECFQAPSRASDFSFPRESAPPSVTLSTFKCAIMFAGGQTFHWIANYCYRVNCGHPPNTKEVLLMSVLLLYGRDPDLLRSRQWLLEKQGYRVLVMSDRNDLQQITEPVDLLILCHTITLDDCATVTSLAASRWPGLRELVLVARTSEPQCTSGTDTFLTLEGPAKLVAAVRTLVQPTHNHVAEAPF